jgi:hypothetical protein
MNIALAIGLVVLGLLLFVIGLKLSSNKNFKIGVFLFLLGLALLITGIYFLPR